MSELIYQSSASEGMGIYGSTGPASLSSPPLYLPEYQRGKLQSAASIVAVTLKAGHGS